MWKVVVAAAIAGIAIFYVYTLSISYQKKATENAAWETRNQQQKLALQDPAQIAAMLSSVVKRTDNGWILQKNGGLEDTVFVSKTPIWQINCGVLGVHLQSSETANDNEPLDIEISSASLDDSECSTVLPIIGREVNRFFQNP